MGTQTLARLASLMADAAALARNVCVATQVASGQEATPEQQAVRSPQQAPVHGRVQMRVGYGVNADGRSAGSAVPSGRQAPGTGVAQAAGMTIEVARAAGSGRQAPVRVPVAAPPPTQTREELVAQVVAEADRAATAGASFERPVGRPLTNYERGQAIRQVWADAYPGRVNDGKRGCSVCGADETMLCDRVAHAQAEEAAKVKGAPPPTDDTAARYDKLELEGGPTKPRP